MTIRNRPVPVFHAVLAILACCTAILAGCTGTVPATSSEAGNPEEEWRFAELQDITTGETFSVNSFSGMPVILYTFTVTCPICTRQQMEITALKKALGDGVVIIGLDIDPKEEAATLENHIRSHGFLGYYAIPPREMLPSLVDRFGTVVATPAYAPVIVICPGGDARLLDQGIKTSSALASTLQAVC